MSIEKNIERIAVALEKLAEIKNQVEAEVKPKLNLELKKAMVEVPGKVEAEEVETKEDKKQSEFSKEDRQQILEELQDLGVTFGTKQSTKYLAELLEREKVKAQTPKEAVKEEVVEEQLAEVVEEKKENKVINLDEIREMLKGYADTKGVPAAKFLLNKYGANNVSTIPATKIDAFVKEISL